MKTIGPESNFSSDIEYISEDETLKQQRGIQVYRLQSHPLCFVKHIKTVSQRSTHKRAEMYMHLKNLKNQCVLNIRLLNRKPLIFMHGMKEETYKMILFQYFYLFIYLRLLLL